MLKRSEKTKIVEELTERFRRQKIAIISDVRGVSVSKFQALRRSLRQGAAEFKVSKKTLFDRALAAVGIGIRTKPLQGEIGVAFGYGDVVSAAKILAKFGKENDTFKILAGILNGQMLEPQQILALAKLPSREVLLAQLVWALQSPIQGLATTLQGNMRNLVVVLNRVRENRV